MMVFGPIRPILGPSIFSRPSQESVKRPWPPLNTLKMVCTPLKIPRMAYTPLKIIWMFLTPSLNLPSWIWYAQMKTNLTHEILLENHCCCCVKDKRKIRKLWSEPVSLCHAGLYYLFLKFLGCFQCFQFLYLQGKQLTVNSF